VFLHRTLTDCPDGLVVDHRSGNSLDNRRLNLRICTHAENSRNRVKAASGSLRFKGLSRHRGKYIAYITVDRKRRYLGVFASQEEARAAYARGAALYHGEFARAE